MPILFAPTSTSGTIGAVEIMELRTSDGVGNFPSSDDQLGRRRFVLDMAFQTPNIPLIITGIEFSESGRHVYVLTKDSPILYWYDIDDPVFNTNDLDGSSPLFVGTLNQINVGGILGGGYEGSQIEMGADGNMYFMADEDIL